MEGKGAQLSEGIEVFNRKSRSSVQAVILKVKSKLDQCDQDRLQNASSTSSQTLRVLRIHHQGDLSNLIVAVAEKCPSLLKLSAFRLGSEYTLYRHATGLPSIGFSPLWKASLETFIWKAGGGVNLNTNVHLLERLRNAKEVTISSPTLTPT